jgi:ribonucleoside-diphosphate reductase beta chain
MMENIHSETSLLLILTWRRMELFNALEVFLLLRKRTGLWNGSVRLQSVWLLLQWRVSFSVHFVLFTGWKGLTFSNRLISRDEEFTVILVHLHNHHLVNKVPKDRIRSLWMLWILKRVYHWVVTSIFNWNERRIDDTVLEFVADRLLVELGCDREYNTANPLILWIWFHCKEKQFLWEKVAEYQKQVWWTPMKKHKK